MQDYNVCSVPIGVTICTSWLTHGHTYRQTAFYRLYTITSASCRAEKCCLLCN